jgi:phosphoglycolate phosphatase-like HAD superfamily hydrolase
MASQTPQPGLTALMAYLDARGIRKGVCTRNFDAPVHHLLSTFVADSVFHPIVTRDFRPPKPDPAGILHIAKTWGLTRPRENAVGGATSTVGDADARNAGGVPASEASKESGVTARSGNGVTAAVTSKKQEADGQDVVVGDASGLIMVGDSIDDMTAGRRAGAATVLLVNDVNAHLVEHAHTDLVISRLDELVDILEGGFEGLDSREIRQNRDQTGTFDGPRW